MAVFVPFPGGAQAELLFVLDGKVIENRLWFYTAGDPPGSAELLGLADGVYDWHTTYILPYLSQDLQLATVLATDWSVPFGPSENTTGAVVNGSIPEESHSANVGIKVRFRWALQYGRQRTNKNTVPGIPLSEIDLNTPTAAIQNTLFEGYAALIDAARTFAPGDYWYWVTASSISNNVPRSEMLFAECTGPFARDRLILAQRRGRLPA